MTRQIAFATCRQIPALHDDDLLVIDHLCHQGIDVCPLIWDADDIPPDRYASIVIRSCWDYHYQPNRFLEWVRGVRRRGVPLWNPASVVEWNLNKIYLRDLREKGVLVPQTIWLEKGSEADLPAILAQQRWRKAVVKPAISATAFRTFMISPETAGHKQPALDEMLSLSEVIVQQFVDEVLTRGEWSLLFFGGNFSHAVLKRPRAGDFRVQEEFGGRTMAAVAPPRLIEDAARIISLLEEPLLFARVDGLEVDGRLLLMELELIEPLLFLSYDREAPKRFADAIVSLSKSDDL
jgi:hypothetical protein